MKPRTIATISNAVQRERRRQRALAHSPGLNSARRTSRSSHHPPLPIQDLLAAGAAALRPRRRSDYRIVALPRPRKGDGRKFGVGQRC